MQKKLPHNRSFETASLKGKLEAHVQEEKADGMATGVTVRRAKK